MLMWKDCPIECASLFHVHIDKFMQQYIILGAKVLNSVKEYVICYELWFHGFVHAHFIIWIENADFEQITNEITATVLAIYDNALENLWKFAK